MLIRIKKTAARLFSLLIILSTLIIHSCEPQFCASCYDYSHLIRDKTVVICTDNLDELYWLMDETELMGYRCQEDW